MDNKIEFRTNAYMQVDDFALSTHIQNLITTYGLEKMAQIGEYLVKINELNNKEEQKAG